MNLNWHSAMSLVAGLSLASCSQTAVIGHFHAMRDAAPAARDAAASGTDAGSESTPVGDSLAIEPGTHAQFCAGNGSALRVVPAANTSSTQICGPGIGRRLFRYGLCACGDLSAPQTLSTFTLDAFDSRKGPYDAGESGGAVGIDGALRVGDVAFAVNGTAIVAGGGELMLSNTISVNVSADLKTNALIEAAAGGVLHVGRDLWSDGDIHGGLISSVMGDVYQTPGHAGAESIGSVGGSRQTRSFTIDPPCACGQDRALDIAGLVAEAQRTNDNAELGVSAVALSEMLQQGTVPAGLACGRFVVPGVSLPPAVLRTLTGRLALFIAGDLTLQGDFASDLSAQAELDVFITGNLIVRGTAQLGMPARPSAVRLYIAGSAPVELNDRVKLAAQIYAPHAPAQGTEPSINSIPLYGSIVAASFDVPRFFAIHYDRAVAELGERCDAAQAPRCESCEHCPSGLACVDGACAACRTDADCCEPFGCAEGKCQPLIYPAAMP